MADPIKTAKRIFDQFLSKADPAATITKKESPTVSIYMAQIGSEGGKIGGKRRLETMSPKRRKIVARKAAQARWSKAPK